MPSCGTLWERRASAYCYAISGCAAAILSVLARLTDTAVPPQQTIQNVVIAFVSWNSYFRGIKKNTSRIFSSNRGVLYVINL